MNSLCSNKSLNFVSYQIGSITFISDRTVFQLQTFSILKSGRCDIHTVSMSAKLLAQRFKAAVLTKTLSSFSFWTLTHSSKIQVGVCSAFRLRAPQRSNQFKSSNQRPTLLQQAEFLPVIAVGERNLGQGLTLITSLVFNSGEGRSSLRLA